MKITKRYYLFILGLVLSTNFAASTSMSKEIEKEGDQQNMVTKMNIQKVLIPNLGYDDNDNIQIVIDGHLPNICYDALKPEYTVDLNKKIIQIVQFAKRKQIQGCSDVDITESGFKYPVSSTTVIELGVLPAGKYIAMTNSNSDQKIQSEFTIQTAQTETVDNSLYAPIKSAFIPDMIYETTKAQLILSGILDSPCMRIRAENIEVKKQGDVIVVLPKMTMRNSRSCSYNPRPLQQVVALGSLNEGRYLIHIRTITGGSINRVFTVVKRGNADNRRH